MSKYLEDIPHLTLLSSSSNRGLRVQARGRPLPSVRGPRLPLGPPNPHHEEAEGVGGRRLPERGRLGAHA